MYHHNSDQILLFSTILKGFSDFNIYQELHNGKNLHSYLTHNFVVAFLMKIYNFLKFLYLIYCIRSVVL